jgi:hypothetical protein
MKFAIQIQLPLCVFPTQAISSDIEKPTRILTTATVRHPCVRVVNQDVAHHLRRQYIQMHTIVPGYFAPVQYPEIELIHQLSEIQRAVYALLASQKTGGSQR